MSTAAVAVMATDDDWVAAARAALDTHDALLRVLSAAPGTVASYGDWYADVIAPAYRVWARAMDRLAWVLADDFPGRDPERFRPVCAQILSGEFRCRGGR